ncbi:MAG: DUF456 domain-containing protein [Candidatus Pacebacteria bacterium]|nr:DUF456 domain-containing protein [Candidatus Paceibacterota bacterium]
MELWIKILFAMLMLPGLFMMLTPLLPGIPYMFLMATLYGVLDGFQSFSPWMIAVFGGFVILAGLVDYFAGVLGARYGGARSYSLKLGFIGMILGTVIVPPFGSFVGLFLGIVAGEVFRIGCPPSRSSSLNVLLLSPSGGPWRKHAPPQMPIITFKLGKFPWITIFEKLLILSVPLISTVSSMIFSRPLINKASWKPCGPALSIIPSSLPWTVPTTFPFSPTIFTALTVPPPTIQMDQSPITTVPSLQ